jgi:hypothetical protein
MEVLAFASPKIPHEILGDRQIPEIPSHWGTLWSLAKSEIFRPIELAEALSNAPAGDMFIRAVWPDTTNSTMRIGPQTVAAWRTIFKAQATLQPF